MIREIQIQEIKSLLNEYNVEVDSPDGWVGVNYFVEKGDFEEYRLIINDECVVRCNSEHLFETPFGWLSAAEIYENVNFMWFLSEEKNWVEGRIIKTGKKIPIVDINVNHDNHRYYANGISSHNTGIGKSMVMCDLAANYMKNGYNVLYITMEMAEEKIAERIDANLLSINMDDLKKTSTEMLHIKMNDIKTKTVGKLKIKEYPTGAPHVGHFRFLLKELKSKQNFIPDIIFIDYIGICAASKMKDKSNSYSYIKAIYEEVRGFAIENNVVLWTANQSNRDGNNNTDADITNVADSMGGPMTSDILLMLISNEDLASMNQVLIKQLKNRYADVFKYNKFNVGVDRSKMRLYDLNNTSAYNQPKQQKVQSQQPKNNTTNRFGGIKT